MSTQSSSVGIPSVPSSGAVPVVASRPIAASSPGFWLPIFSLWWRELVRFYRQRSRVAGVLGSPLIFWLVVGSGIGSSFRPDGAKSSGYLEYFFPGTIILIILFTSIFTMMSVIEDRKEGFLLSVLVSPASRGSLVMGKVLGGSTLALIQGMIFLFLGPTGWNPSESLQHCHERGNTLPGLIRINQSRVSNCLETGFDSWISRIDKSVSCAHVAGLGRVISDFRSIRLDRLDNAHKPIDVRNECVAHCADSAK